MKRSTTGSTLNHGGHWWPALVCGLLLAVIGVGLPGALSSAQAHDFGGGTNPNPPPTDPPPPPPCKERCCNQGTGKPVSWLDGAERLREIDLQVAGIYPIILTRGYDSASLYDTPLGYGWAFTHDRRLFEYPDGSIVIRHGCGQRDRYIQTGGSYVTPTTGVRGRLTAQADGSFVFTYYDGSIDSFDREGRLIAEFDPQGNRHEIVYADTNGDGRPDKFPLIGTSPNAVEPTVPMTVAFVYRVTRIQERTADGSLTGRRIDLAYDEATGRLATVTSDDGRVVTYSHDQTAGATRGNLTQAAGPGDRIQIFAYADPQDDHNATTLQLSVGETPYINTYDTQGRVTLQAHGTGKLAFTYPVSRGRTIVTHTITDPGGAVLYTAPTTYELDADGLPKITTDALGNQTRHFYDTAKNLTRLEIWDKGTGTLTLLKAADYGYNAAGDRTAETVTLDTGEVITRTWTYDQGWVTSEQVVSSLDTAKVFRTEYTLYYDSKGVPTNIKDAKRRRDDGSFQTTSYTYDAKRRLVTTTLPDGVQIVNQYAGGSLYVTKTYFKDSAGNVLPQLQQRFGYDAKGNQSDVWDAKGNLTHTDYDALGRVIAVTNALGEQTLYTYTGDNLTQVEVGHTAADGEGQVTKLIYDGRNNLIETQRKDDNGDFITFQTFTYDSDGNRLTETDAEGRTTSSGFNALGRPVSTTDALGNSTLFAYDATGNLVTLTDAKSRQTRYTYDDLNRLIRTEQLGIDPSAVTARIYDAAGNLTGVTDPEGNTTEFTYDALSRKTAEIKPLGQTLRYAYDSRDRLDTHVTARGYRIKYSYVAWGPVAREDVFNPDNSGTTPDSSILSGYDLAGNLTTSAYDDIQPLTRPLYSISYDALNRPDVNTVGYIPNKSVTLDNDYDRYGNRSTLTVNDGETLTHNYRFDKLNRLVGATLPVGQSFTLDYYATDDRKTIDYPNGVTTAYTYYANGPVKDISVKNSANAVLEPLAYTYDQLLNVDTMTDSDGVHDYAYDGLDRLTEAKHPAGVGLPVSESFAYDRIGNRQDPGNPGVYGYDPNNRILTSPGLTYSFDADGNQTGRSDGTGYVFNGFNRLNAYADGGSTIAAYRYDPTGRRVKKTTGMQTVWYLWDTDSLVGEYAANGDRLQRYAYFPGEYLPAQTQDGNGVYTSHGDRLQTPRLLTDAAQQAVWGMRLEVYGKATLSEDLDRDSKLIKFNLRFPGQYFDSESHINYNYARTYDPSTGRYVQSDPIGLDGDDNPYLYSRGNPTVFFDAFGLCTNPCQQAKAIGLDSGDLGGVICCDGAKSVCVWGTGTASNSEAKKIIRVCIGQHENDHLDDVDCPEKCDGKPTREPFKTGKVPAAEERKAYGIECNCYKNRIKNCKGNKQCIDQVTKEKNYACGQA